MMCVFEERDLIIRPLHVCRCLNAPGRAQESTAAISDVRHMFLKESSDLQDLDEAVEKDWETGQYSNSKDDDQWTQEAANSLVALMKVLAYEGVTLDIFSLLELLAKSSGNGVTAETKRMRLNLVEYELRLELDIFILNGTSVLA